MCRVGDSRVSVATGEGDFWSCDVTGELDSQPMKS